MFFGKLFEKGHNLFRGTIQKQRNGSGKYLPHVSGRKGAEKKRRVFLDKNHHGIRKAFSKCFDLIPESETEKHTDAGNVSADLPDKAVRLSFRIVSGMKVASVQQGGRHAGGAFFYEELRRGFIMI
jgi:hypothetical protein